MVRISEKYEPKFFSGPSIADSNMKGVGESNSLIRLLLSLNISKTRYS